MENFDVKIYKANEKIERQIKKLTVDVMVKENRIRNF